MEKARIEQLLGKVHDLEAGHARMKREFSKILLSETSVADSSRFPVEEASCSVRGGGGTGDCLGIDYIASWKSLSSPTGSSSSQMSDFRDGGDGGGAGSQTPKCEFSARQFLNILQSMGQAVYVMDVNFRIIYWSRAAEKLYGYSAVEALNCSVFELLVDEEYQELGYKVLSQVNGGETWTGLVPLRSKSGKRFPVVMMNSPLHDDDGTLIGPTAVGCDASPLQYERFTLPSTSDFENDDFGQIKRSVTTKHVLDPEQPRQVAISSKISDLATKVGSKLNKVRSKLKSVKNFAEDEVGSSNGFHSHYGSSDANAFLKRDSISSCKDSLGRNASPPIGVASHTDDYGSKLKKDCGETTSIHNISSKVEHWISKKTTKWPWKWNGQECSEQGFSKFGWPWLHGDRDYDHSSPPTKSDFQAKQCVYPVVAEPVEPLSSSFNFSSTRSTVSSSSGCCSPVKKPEIATDLDNEVLQKDLIFHEQIGRGSCGTVYRGLWCGSNVAIKVFSEVEYSEETILSFKQEVSLMKMLRHPNILLFMGAATSPQQLCIVTEFLPRGSLFHLLQKRSDKLDWRRRTSMALDIAQGMNYLHYFTPPIVHRDLKSSNLLVDMNWNVKVADFGLSRIRYETFLTTKTGKGTPQWMAPEVCRNGPSDEKSDIYSFGVILWELATEKIPWEDLNTMQVIGSVGFMGKRLEIPTNVDPRWAAMIESCWQSEPRSRPSFQDLIKRLKELAREYAVKHRRQDEVLQRHLH